MEILQRLEISQDRGEAAALMTNYAKKLELAPNNIQPKLIAGADISYQGNTAYAVAIVMETENFSVVEKATWVGEVDFPYRSGLFTFRESPCLLKVFEKLESKPEVILLDANGILHPQRFGVACYIGLCLGVPTIGCAKTLLLGKHSKVGLSQGSFAYIKDGEELIGVAIRLHANVKPIFVSPGHLFDIETARKLVFQLALESRNKVPLDKQPPTLSHAHDGTVELRKKHTEQ